MRVAIPGIEARMARRRAILSSAPMRRSNSASIVRRLPSRMAIISRHDSRISGSKACLRRVFSMAIDSVSCRRRVDRAFRISCSTSRQGAQFMGHRMSKARNQAGVQLVGLGDQALGGAKRLDAPRIDQENLHLRLDQRHGAACAHSRRSPRSPPGPRRAPARRRGWSRSRPLCWAPGSAWRRDESQGRAKANRRQRRPKETSHSWGWSCPIRGRVFKTARSTVRNKHPHPGPSQGTNPSIARRREPRRVSGSLRSPDATTRS